MKILAHKNLNLHSASSKGRLVHIANKQVKVVPEDVVDHPAFELLVKDGSIVIVPNDDNREDGIKALLEKYPDAKDHIEEARISGSPLHLVAAKLAAKENGDDDESKDENSDVKKSTDESKETDESEESDQESDSDDEDSDEETDEEESE